jgi:hypothetical protein
MKVSIGDLNKERQRLTDDEIDIIMMDHGFDADDESIVAMIRHVEAKLKEKNT